MRSSARFSVYLLASTALSSVTPAVAQNLPTGYATAYGNVGFQRSSGTLTISQSSQNAIVNYNSFSIGRGNTVNINQPNSRSAILNRVTGSAPSTLAGQLNANGQVYLVNPNGIAITKTGVVKVGGGFVASSLGMSDWEFKHGRKHFKGNGSSATVSNAGTITIGRGGYAALIGGEVRNSGMIAVPMGRVGLGSGEMATLDVSGDGFLQVAVPTARGGKNALIQDSGTISAAGGMVVIDAATARAAARNAVNISGTIDSHSISGHNGSIVIGGGEGGTVAVSGTLNVSGGRQHAGGSVAITGRKVRVSGTIAASGRVGGHVTIAAADGTRITGTIKAIGRHGKGGTVTVTGLHIALQGATVNASGTSGGGTVLIGGNAHGAGPLPNAGTVTIDAKSTITADAIGSGDGGQVVVWSQLTTNFAGTISAKGGPNGGNGGTVEVSSHGVLSYTGTTNLLAPQGTTGTLLLDPYDVVISNGTDSGYAAATASGTTTDTPSGTSVISATTLDAQLATANVTITTGAANSAGTDAGNITVAAPITWSSGSLLTLTAANAIVIDAPIAITGAGQLTLNYNPSSLANLSFGLTGIGFTGSVSYAAGSGSGISGQALTINGTNYTLIYNQSEFTALDTRGPDALATSLTSTTNYSNAVVGTFFGTFEGLGNTISNLTISGTGSFFGLFSELQSSGTIRDIGLVGGSVSGSSQVGGLVGNQSEGTITQSYATDSVSGSGQVGGLVGKQNGGTITQSYATGQVSSDSGSTLGGLVGVQGGGTIASSYATGSVSGSNGSQYVGGLVGDQSGAITQSYATGAVTGGSKVGGLVGAEDLGTITQSYATGSVIGGSSFGGLVGNQSGGTTITASYWDTTTSGLTQGVGNVTNATGVTGYTTAQLQGTAPISGSTFFSVATQLSSAFSGGANGLYPYLTAFYPTTPQAMSGIAYSDRGITPLASGSGGPNSVFADIAGTQTSATTGANGYYYILEPAGALGDPGTATLAYTTQDNTAAGAVTGASLIATTGTVRHLDIWGSTLIAPTSDTSLSGVNADGLTTGSALYNSNGNATLAGIAIGTNATTGLGTLADAGYIATGASGFTVNAAVASGAAAGGLYLQTTQGPITVTAAQTLGGPTDLSLYSSATLAFDAPVTMSGAGSVNLAYDTSPATNLSFALGDGLQFTGTLGAGQALTINNQAYTLLYSLAAGTTGVPDTGTSDIAGIDANTAAGGDGGHYALATALTGTGSASSPQFTAALTGSGGNIFSGTFEGLGNTITNLTIGASSIDIGLFGRSNGTIRDIGIVGGSVSGSAGSGGLVGFATGGTITASSASDSVSGGSGSFYVGGLVGFMSAGTVETSYATGAVSGTFEVGGLVGFINGGTVETSYATGAVSASRSGLSYVGGLVGFNGGTVETSYATGAVSSGSASIDVGGLVGENGGTVQTSYFDTQTTGQSAGTGNNNGSAMGLTTEELQGGAATQLGSAFSGGTAGLYPYLTSLFPNGVEAVSGTAYKDAGVTPLASNGNGAVTVTVLDNGTAFGTATTGANGYYYGFGPAGTIASGNSVLAYTATNAATGATNAATLAIATGAANLQNVNIYGNAVTVPTSATSLSGFLNGGTLAQVQTGAQTSAIAADGTIVAAATAINGTTGLGLSASGAFTINQPLTTASTFVVQTATGSALTVANPITIGSGGSLGLLSGGTLALNAPVTVTGGTVALAAAYDTTTVPGTSLLELSFGNGASLTYAQTAPDSGVGIAGQALTIDGQAYTLLYSLANSSSTGPDTGTGDIAGIDANTAAGGDGGHYALATSVSGTGTTFTGALALAGAGSNTFSGTFEGLGNTVANLTIDAVSGSYIGLFGHASGTIRDVGLVGGMVSGGSGSKVGGLVGFQTGGTIASSYATGAVSGGEGSEVGGLVGFQVSGTIASSYATGVVSGGSFVGGLVGFQVSGTIASSYATGAVSGGSEVGGLVGYQTGSTIQSSYATGAVSGGSYDGGLVGYRNSGTILSSYFDTQTTGQSATEGVGNVANDSGVTGYTTRQLQGLDPISGTTYFSTATQLGSAFSGGADGLYPYLTSFYPTTPQAVSGIAYTDAGATPLASGTAGAVTVSLIGNGASLGAATTGANGYYYILAPAGSLASGNNVLAYTSANVATGASNAATLTSATGGTVQTGVNLYGNALTLPTMATTLSGAIAQGTSAATTAANGNAAALAAITGAAGEGFVALGASFTIDQPLTTASTFVVQTATGSALTVANPITIGSGGSLGLLSGGTLALNAPVTVTGGTVALAAAYDTTTVPGTSLLELSFGNGASLTYAQTAPDSGVGIAGQALTIDGQAYTLLYSLANSSSTGPDTGTGDVAGIDANTAAGGDGGHYALATSVSGTGVTFTNALAGAGSNTFSGTFEGLGNTVANLTIDAVSGSYIGLFGQATGTIRDVGLVGGMVSGEDSEVGGLVGVQGGGTIASSYATGAVSGGEGSEVGGLVGYQVSGTIESSYATGVVSGGSFVGGLVGIQAGGTIASSYATGAVSGGSEVGGLVGYQTGSTIQSSYATGAVSGGSYDGGLVGYRNSGTITSSYWDTQTTGQIAGGGASTGTGTVSIQGLTTAQLQGTASLNGGSFDLGAAFSGGAAGGTAGLYPYLTSLFPNGVQAVSGIAYTDAGTTLLASPASGTSGNGLPSTQRPGYVSVAANGASLATVTTGANGYYYVAVAAGTLPAGDGVVAYTVADQGTNGSGATNAASYAVAGAATTTPTTTNVPDLDIYGGWQFDRAGTSATLSAINSADATAAGTLAPASFALANREIVSSAPSLTLDAAVDISGTFAINATGSVTQSADITAGALLVEGGGAFALTGTNVISTLAASSAALAVETSGALTIGTVTDATGTATNGISATGSVTVASGGNQILSQAVSSSGGGVLLAADGTFTNNAGSSAVTATGGFTIYTQNAADPTGVLPSDSFGSLIATNYYNDAYAFTAGTFASSVPAGNHFVYADEATLTPVLTGSASKTYDTTTTAPTNDLTVTATGFLGATDSATLSFDNASYGDANAGSNKAVTADGIALVLNPNNYRLDTSMASANVGTIGKATVTVAGATGVDKTYDTTTALPNGASGFTDTGVYASDGGNVTVTATSAAYASANAGPDAVDVSGLSLGGSAAGNYQLSTTSVVGSGTIGKATVTVAGATGVDKTYDTTTALPNGASGFTDTGVYASDAGNVTVTATSAAYASANAGPDAVDVSGLSLGGSAAGNYQLSATSVVGSGTIGKATITVAGATGVDKTYDTTTALPNGASGFSDTGVYASDAGNVTVTATSAAYASANAGPDAVDVSGLSLGGSAAGNYQLSATSVVGSGTIGKATITVAGATGVDKTYDTTTALPNGASGFTDTGVYASDAGNVTVTATSAAYASANAGPDAVDVSGLSLGGSAAGNYQLSATSVMGSGTIGKATVIVTALGGTSIYGNSPNNPGLSATGLQGGQGVGVLTGLSNSFGIDGRTNAGTYTVSVVGTLTNPNYAVGSTVAGSFDVTPRPLTITADDETRVQGFANPPLAYQIGGLGLVDGDALTGSLFSPATIASSVGAYPIVQGTLAASSNYAVTYVPGALTVSPSADQSAATLGSTADRDLWQIFGRLSDGLPFLLPQDGNDTTASEIIRDLGDPRFDETIVCFQDVCTIAVTPKLTKTTSLEPSP